MFYCCLMFLKNLKITLKIKEYAYYLSEPALSLGEMLNMTKDEFKLN